MERERARLQEKLRRLKGGYLEVLIDEEEFRRGKAEVEDALARLKPPPAARIEVSATNLKVMRLAWQSATKKQKSEIAATLFETVYCDPASKSLVALRPKPAFALLFSQIEILKQKASKFEIRYD